jgi:hypothetical protein
MALTVLAEAARDADLEVGYLRPGTGGAADDGHQDGAEGTVLVVDATKATGGRVA